MRILGISQNHNASICLIEDGEIKLHCENERLSGIKHHAKAYDLLDTIKDSIDYMVISGFSPNKKYNQDYEKYLKDKGHKFKTINVWSSHHLFHASHAFYNSGFDKALSIVIDGMGSEYYFNNDNNLKGGYGREQRATFVAEYPNNFTEIDKDVVANFKYDSTNDHVKVSNDVSEGQLFEMTSSRLGFTPFDAGKVMALAAYGKNRKYHIVGNQDLYDITNLRKPKLNIEFGDSIQNVYDFCGDLQRQCQENVLQYIKDKVVQTGITKVCLSGGYFLNCVANHFYKDNLDGIELYIEPVATDAGQSIGIAKYFWHELNNDTTIRKQKSIYYGYERKYDNNVISTQFKDFEVLKADEKVVAAELRKKKLIGVYGQKSESGPRALGNRSLLFDPTVNNGKDIVNKTKKREPFRPFACSMKEECLHEYFDTKLDSSPFMMYAMKTKVGRDIIPAVLHIDDTCRVQTVNKKQHEHLYNIIDEFEKISGVPMVLNTSFNLAGNPIVETITDVYNTFKDSDIDCLYFYETKQLIRKLDK